MKKSKKLKIIVLFLFFCCVQANGQIQDQKVFPLPEIRELNYLYVPSALERIFPSNSCQDNLIKLLKNYTRRLSDIRENEVYIVKHSCEFFQSTCLCFETTAQGEFTFLILFNRKSKQANVLIVSYDFLSDSEVYSMSYIIKKNEIRLTDSGMTEGEDGNAEEFIKNTFTVCILKSGKIKIKL